ncbi:MAG: MBL fold metallo-hydrolase [Anaerovoracaceae bacterium]
MNSEELEVFGPDFDRFGFAGSVYRVTAGHGGEAILIIGSEKTALIDCGMAYCGGDMVLNIKKRLKDEGRESLNCVFLTHSHYDHMGALPYVISAFPDAVIYGSEHCREILKRPNAKALMKTLGTAARKLYIPESDMEISVENLKVDIALKDGDTVSLGEETITALETKGHTDCSMSYVLEPLSILFASESTGLIEAEFQICTPILKSFKDAFESLEKCRNYGAKRICLPHFGLIPEDFNNEYWQMFEDECMEKIRLVKDMKEKGFTQEEMLEKFKERMWKPVMEKEQPIEAFLINTKNTIKAALKEV